MWWGSRVMSWVTWFITAGVKFLAKYKKDQTKFQKAFPGLVSVTQLGDAENEQFLHCVDPRRLTHVRVSLLKPSLQRKLDKSAKVAPSGSQVAPERVSFVGADPSVASGPPAQPGSSDAIQSSASHELMHEWATKEIGWFQNTPSGRRASMGGKAGAPSTMSVTIPPDAMPGVVLHVQAPDGASITFTVPNGAMPGTVVEMQYMPQSAPEKSQEELDAATEATEATAAAAVAAAEKSENDLAAAVHFKLKAAHEVKFEKKTISTMQSEQAAHLEAGDNEKVEAVAEKLKEIDAKLKESEKALLTIETEVAELKGVNHQQKQAAAAAVAAAAAAAAEAAAAAAAKQQQQQQQQQQQSRCCCVS